VKGVLHAHTNLSHDGTLNLKELRSFFKFRGFDFLCLTDHSQDLNNYQYQELKRTSHELSDNDFVLIPGIEYSCDGEVHIMGIGIGNMTEKTKPQQVIDHIHQNGGIAVWAHPTKMNYPSDPEWISKLDGVEIWNLASDGKYLPQSKSIKAYFDFKRINPTLLAFFGMDFHHKERYYDLSLRLDGVECTEKHILAALKAGRFLCTSRTLKLSSEPELNKLKQTVLAFIRSILNLIRVIRDRLRRE